MALLVPSSRDDDSLSKEHSEAAPLLAGVMRDEIRERDFDKTLQEARAELAEDGFVASLGKFREALTLSEGRQCLRERLWEVVSAEAAQIVAYNWRVAEALVAEIERTPAALDAEIQQRKREETIQAALEEARSAEESGYLPPMRARLARLLESYPGEARLEGRLRALDGTLEAQAAAERAKNLRRLARFRERLQFADNPETLRRFRVLAAPWAERYHDDPEFAAILQDVAGLWSAYESARTLLGQGRPRESIQACEDELGRRPGNMLFRWLREKAKAREWVAVLADSTRQRAHEFAEGKNYAAALEELESLRNIDPAYPGLEAETRRYRALSRGAKTVPAAERKVTRKAREELTGNGAATAALVPPPAVATRASGFKIAITEHAWDRLKTGLVATFALLMVMLLFASNLRR